MARFTAIVDDEGANEYKRYVLDARSADDVHLKLLQWEYERSTKAGEIDKVPDINLESQSELEDAVTDFNLIAVFAGDHPNLITPDKGCEDYIINPEWKPSV